MWYNHEHQFVGMHLFWWIIWIVVMVWIFATPYNIPGQRKKNDSPLEILQKRFAAGQITKEIYEEHKALLEKDLPK